MGRWGSSVPARGGKHVWRTVGRIPPPAVELVPHGYGRPRARGGCGRPAIAIASINSTRVAQAALSESCFSLGADGVGPQRPGLESAHLDAALDDLGLVHRLRSSRGTPPHRPGVEVEHAAMPGTGDTADAHLAL